MEALAKQQMVDGLDINLTHPPKFCESCAKGKGHRLPFKGTSGKKADHPLDLVHSDVCGKIGTKSLSGGEYFVTFIDDHTRHVWVFVLKHKDEMFACFKQWKAQVERSTGRQVKTLRSDNGGEYTSKEFALYLAKEGIKHELTTPRTPQQNDVAERLNRTLVEGVRAMLADSKLTHRFWAEALSTMAYLRNRSPTKAQGGVTSRGMEWLKIKCPPPPDIWMQCLRTRPQSPKTQARLQNKEVHTIGLWHRTDRLSSL